jgi:hypothetical protein
MSPSSIFNNIKSVVSKYAANGAGTIALVLLVVLLIAICTGAFLLGAYLFVVLWNYGVVGTFTFLPTLTTLKAAALLLCLDRLAMTLGLKKEDDLVALKDSRE